ncbi:MAG: hypothetical protein U0L48_09795 [Acutalibacteraceae bacterium]|nr:hypothetical protein [Acutalibacteraceae bacterium]
MKTAAKVFIIIGMICGFWWVLPLVFGIIVLVKMKNDQLTTGWKVVTLIFVSLIGGILLLCAKDQPAPAVETTTVE